MFVQVKFFKWSIPREVVFVVNLSEIVQVKQFKISSSELIKVRKIDLNQDIYHALFL